MSKNIRREIFYKEFVQRENTFFRAPYNPELEFYSMVKAGNVKRVKELCKETLLNKVGLGTLSSDPLQNIKYHFVITTAMVARYCIEGGMELSVAYSLSDFYIQKADACQTPKEVSDLHPIMCEDYTKRVRALQKKEVCSKQVVICLDYIYDHLHTRITVSDLADFVGCNSSYLSRLFKEQIGCSISQYIQTKKIETACNMLAYSDYSVAQIASILAYPSQSYFTEIFKKSNGTTPLKYREQNFRSTEMK